MKYIPDKFLSNEQKESKKQSHWQAYNKVRGERRIFLDNSKTSTRIQSHRKIANLPKGVLDKNTSLTQGKSATDLSVADLFAIVKTYDKDFKPKSVSPMVLNDNGTPKISQGGI